MTSSRPESAVTKTGAHRAHRDARKRVAPRQVPRTTPPGRYDPCLDGLFTYCLSVLCDHDAATAAVGDVLHIAERRGSRGPDSGGELKAWLYALARWVCLRRLAEAKRSRHAAHATGEKTGRTPKDPPRDAGPAPGAARPSGESEEVQRERRSELARLAWPEAAGTTPEQREALELAVRHQLTPAEVAAVLGMDPTKARELLASAACEVERTRAALAVVETGSCPIVARLTGDNQLLLGTALRRELVRHVDDCPRCRRTAERAGAGTWPGTAVSPATLPLIEAPRTALHRAMAHAPRARGVHPRYDRRGFPMDPKDHAARRDRLRARAVTTTVVATVVAAPVLALWAAYRGPLTGEGRDGGSVTASEDEGAGGLGSDHAGDGYENAGNARKGSGPHFTAGSRSSDVSVEVISGGGSSTGPGSLTVTARPSGDITLITLTASGSAPVDWSAGANVSWLYLNRSSGTLAPGETVTLRVYVDHRREPSGPWRARVSIAPSGAVVSIDGHGGGRPPHTPDPGPRPTDPRPTDPGPSDPDPGPDPTPRPTDPDPSDPDPTPTPTEPTSTPSYPGPGGPSAPPGDGATSPG
ncbi:BACON domain-containing protein [Streptomyces sp. DSM 118878]